MAQKDFAGTKRIDAGVIAKIRSIQGELSTEHGPSGGTFAYSAAIEDEGTFRVVSVKETGSKGTPKDPVAVKRIYQNDDAMDTDDTVEKRLLNARLFTPSPDGLQAMMIASDDRPEFGRILRAERTLIKNTTTDPANKLFYNAFLRRMFFLYKDLAQAKSFIRGGNSLGFQDEADDAYEMIDLGAIGQGKQRAIDFFLAIPDGQTFESYKSRILNGISVKGAYKSERRTKAMISDFIWGVGGGNNGKGYLADVRGEMLAVKVMTTLMSKDYEIKYCCVDKKGSQGIDQIWGTRGDGLFIQKYVILECKGSINAHENHSSQGKQMSEKWVVASLMDIWKTKGRNQRLVEKILTAAIGQAEVSGMKRNNDVQSFHPYYSAGETVKPRVNMMTISSLHDPDHVYKFGDTIKFSVADRGDLNLRRYL